MTWKEFKEQVEAEGVKDDMEIDYIDISMDYGDGLCVNVDRNSFSVH